MNLIQHPWLPFLLQDGSRQILPLASICRSDIIDFALPREDFKGAAYQLCIGLLQTTLAPEDEEEWLNLYELPPAQHDLQKEWNKVAHAFNAFGDGPLFMQDFNSLDEKNTVPVSGLLIDAPGDATIKKNTDHFVKRGICEVMSPEMAILALFTLQINAPAGGAGHRTGLRGGGPLTTIILPQAHNTSLWQKLWLNVIHRDLWRYDEPNLNDGSVFPWLAPTKVSSKEGSETYHTNVHPLHMYWAMPRRIRLQIKESECTCDISGTKSTKSIAGFITKNYGYNYKGNWSHPLTPYKWNPKKPNQEHLSIKGQPGGITWKTWDLLTLTNESAGQRCAKTVHNYQTIIELMDAPPSKQPRLWAFAYDMDNMKPRCWYSRTLPLFSVSAKQLDIVFPQIKTLQQLADLAVKECLKQIKAAWSHRPKDLKGDMSFIGMEFWARTETTFFNTIEHIINNPSDNENKLTSEQAEQWLKQLRSVCFGVFDEAVFSVPDNDKTLSDRVKARLYLTKWLFSSKVIKTFIADYHIPIHTKKSVERNT